MADTTHLRSPLAGLADRLAAAGDVPARIRLAEVPFLTQLTLRVAPGTPAAEAAARALGAPLPTAPNTTSAHGDVVMLWMGPDEWLVVARDVLLKGCALDLHPRAFDVGRCVQTLLARAQVVLVARTNEPAYWVFVRASFAEYLAEWLLDAAAEYRRAAPLELALQSTPSAVGASA